MKKTEIPIMRYVILGIIAIVLFFAFGWVKTRDDIEFCHQIFSGLIKGSFSVQKLIDWENLKAVGVDVGATYLSLPDEKQKSAYQESFIKGFSLAFRQAGGKLKSFTNWRISDKDIEQTQVAVDYKEKGKTLLFTISKPGKRKLVGIQWK